MTAGENALEVTTSRRAYMDSLADSLVENGMELRREDVRERYITLMTTPDSHNDTYAGTCHRLFFANRANGLPLDECPDPIDLGPPFEPSCHTSRSSSSSSSSSPSCIPKSPMGMGGAFRCEARAGLLKTVSASDFATSFWFWVAN